jgi:ubiquinone/menaquinone biosynthesis C-methylase UbiE
MDAVICGRVVDHLTDPYAALGELARICRTGAPVVIVTTRQHAPGAARSLPDGGRRRAPKSS